MEPAVLFKHPHEWQTVMAERLMHYVRVHVPAPVFAGSVCAASNLGRASVGLWLGI
jgi:hypothetical protein